MDNFDNQQPKLSATHDETDDHNSYVNLIYGATTAGGGTNTVIPLTSNEFNILNNTTKSSHKKRDISVTRYLNVDENSYNNGHDNLLLNNNISPKIISSNITIRSSRHPVTASASLQNRTNTPSILQQQTVHSNTSMSQQQQQQQQQHLINSPGSLTHNILSNSSLERKKTKNTKTTSDSNVKLLADHNFYHVTNRNNGFLYQHQLQQQQQIPPPPTISSSSSASSSLSNKASNEKNEELFKNMLFNNSSTNNNMIEVSKPYELSDFYKYSTRYRNSNSSTGSSSTTNTNNLLMINTAINNNNYENNEQLQKLQIYSTPNDTSSHVPLQNTKYSNRVLNTPPSSTSASILYDSIQYLQTNGNSPKYYPVLSHNNSISDLTASNATSNSISLNLSIHTAEEFGKEMLAWLQNEHKRNNSSSNLAQSSAPSSHHHIHITTNPNDSSTATTAATLV